MLRTIVVFKLVSEFSIYTNCHSDIHSYKTMVMKHEMAAKNIVKFSVILAALLNQM